MACGELPFQGEHMFHLFQAIVNGHGWAPKPSFSPLLIDLLGKLLAPNPDDRPSAKEILKHPWMRLHPYSDEQLHSLFGEAKKKDCAHLERLLRSSAAFFGCL